MARLRALALVLAAAGTAAAVALAAQSPRQLRDSIFAAARAEHSVHYVSRSSGPGGSATIVADVGATKGVQRISFHGGGKSGRATVLVVQRTAYIRGDATALRGFFGVTAAQARRFAHKWLTIPQSSPAYAGIAAAVTLGSFLGQIHPQSNLVRVSGSVGGRRVVGVHGVGQHEGERLVQTLYARAGGKPLPIQEKEKGPAGYQGVTAIGPWNGPVRARAPGHAAAVSRVLG